MRKLSLITLSIIMLVGIISCEKNETAPMSENDRTVQNILDFKSSVLKKSGNGENMLIDSALWYIEATVNMSYAFTHEVFINQETDSLFVPVETINGCEVAFDDVVNVFNTMKKFVCDQYLNYPAQDKHIIIVDLQKDEDSENGTGLWIFSNVGEVVEDNGDLKSTTPFGYYDFYKALNPGRCNGYDDDFPTTENSADALQRVSHWCENLKHIHNPLYFYTDVSTKWFMGYDIWVNPDPQTQDEFPTLIYFESCWGRTCLSPEDMYFLLHAMDDVIYSIDMGEKKPGYIKVKSESPTGGKDEIMHYYLVDFGIQHNRFGPPEDPAPGFE